ncbi:TAXI family TRAP transporter solute-binding subunit [Parasedimentitalea maritima]|uniref:TRAP transporter solute receptor, TAXI family n=1 Tax=Parasedimentitalea maritima TaxID=2578117 RepID=A0A6A4RNL7_9RHOB|nr:TAXI family TRAP transporter solute-binding subunit [Zongyanglinia marina]KAE9632591.1 hypothetical protein GP644_02110 [Zongyanglinia marina]
MLKRLNNTRFWALFGVAAILTGSVVMLFRLHPPMALTLAAGPSGGAYHQLAGRYRAILARDGIDLVVVDTAGSAENAGLIETTQVDAAFLQGGIAVQGQSTEAIGAIFFEPMVFLTRQDIEVPANPALWSDLRISSGRLGSGTAAAFDDFQAAVGLRPALNQHFDMGYSDAVSALIEGTIDVAVFVAPIDAPYLVAAYADHRIRLLPLDYSEAISRRLNYANTVTVPTGAISLKPVVPPVPRQLLALEARLAISDSLHPALVNRLTMAAIELHSARDIITDQGQFPSVEGTGLSVNNAARQLILNGPSTWHDWLPYWMAAQVNRLFLLMLPILFLLLPMLRAVPSLYAFLMRWRVLQHYPEIKQIEDDLAQAPDLSLLVEMDQRLVELDERLAQVRLPPLYRQTAYNARIHIELVRKRISAQQEAVAF